MAGFALNLLAGGMLGLYSTVQAYPLNETGEQVPAPALATLQPSRACQASLPVFGHFEDSYVAPNATMAMSSGGGWCWFAFTLTFRDVPSDPTVSVAAPPSHGQATIQMADGRYVVAYQPAPGFVGSDSFSVRTDGPFPHTIPVQVMVSG
jgi:hypothetical protein